MAVELIAKCFKTPYPPAPKIVLIALCDFSNDKGICFPSLRTLCQSCTISCSNINYILNTFVVIKLIHREKRKRENGSNTSSLIYINVKKLDMVANSEDKKKFLEEYLTAYRQETQSKKPIIGQAKNQSLDKGQNQSLDKLIQSIGQLEPSINRQGEISKDISLFSCGREKFSKNENERISFNSFVNFIKANFKNKTIATTQDKYTGDTLKLSISEKGRMYNKLDQSFRDLDATRAVEIFETLYSKYLAGDIELTKDEIIFINLKQGEAS